MTEENGTRPPVAPEPSEPTGPARASGHPTEAGALDAAEISTAACLAAKVHCGPDIRDELVRHVRAKIDDGTYETPAKIEGTVAKLMEELAEYFS